MARNKGRDRQHQPKAAVRSSKSKSSSDFGLPTSFTEAREAVETATGRIPRNAIYWGLGAAAIGAAAYAAYTYRSQLRTLISSAMEQFDSLKESVGESLSSITESSEGEESPRAGARGGRQGLNAQVSNRH